LGTIPRRIRTTGESDLIFERNLPSAVAAVRADSTRSLSFGHEILIQLVWRL